MILADTSAWIDYLRGAATPAADALDAVLGKEEVVIGDLILVELLQGYRRDQEAKEIAAGLSDLPIVTLCGPQLAPRAADNYRFLRANGVTVRGTIDVIIATWCIANDVRLIAADRDFHPMEKLLGLKRFMSGSD
jgi:predicted nucleic acid-binding protein